MERDNIRLPPLSPASPSPADDASSFAYIPSYSPPPSPQSIAQPASASIENSVKIGIIGTKNSGKTTYIAALGIAALLNTEGQWSVLGTTDAAIKYLLEMTDKLLKKNFPTSTQEFADDHIFKISGQTTSGLGGLLGRTNPISFALHFRDYPGGQFASELESNSDMWRFLAECDGLLFLYDSKPQDAVDAESNFRIINQAVNFINGVKLPGQAPTAQLRTQAQYLAVCATKIDDQMVFNQLQAKDGIIKQEPKGSIPVVTDHQAAFEIIANDQIGRLTQKLIKSSFTAKRTQYFMTTAIGFYAPTNGLVDPQDCQNTEPDSQAPSSVFPRQNQNPNLPIGTKKRIRGDIVPVNVFAPLRWIASQIKTK